MTRAFRPVWGAFSYQPQSLSPAKLCSSIDLAVWSVNSSLLLTYIGLATSQNSGAIDF